MQLPDLAMEGSAMGGAMIKERDGT
ncbi:MAG: hypothetical protein RL685_1693, partial [Pseudomonadota bacterium]